MNYAPSRGNSGRFTSKRKQISSAHDNHKPIDLYPLIIMATYGPNDQAKTGKPYL